MSYTPPAGNAINVTWQDEAAYTPPAGNAVNVAWPSDAITGTGAVTVDFTVAATGAQGVIGTGAVAVDFTPDAAGTYTSNAVVGVEATTLDFTVEGVGVHGVGGPAAVSVDFSVAAAGDHGVGGTASVSVDFPATIAGAHGEAGTCDVSVGFTPAATAIHHRYELAGEVRQSGVLINRRVRAYRRDTGALVGEVDTTLGKFKMTVGFASREHYVVPVNLADDAADWSPPTQNRVVSYLAQDA